MDERLFGPDGNDFEVVMVACIGTWVKQDRMSAEIVAP